MQFLKEFLYETIPSLRLTFLSFRCIHFENIQKAGTAEIKLEQFFHGLDKGKKCKIRNISQKKMLSKNSTSNIFDCVVKQKYLKLEILM